MGETTVNGASDTLLGLRWRNEVSEMEAQFRRLLLSREYFSLRTNKTVRRLSAHRGFFFWLRMHDDLASGPPSSWTILRIPIHPVTPLAEATRLFG